MWTTTSRVVSRSAWWTWTNGSKTRERKASKVRSNPENRSSLDEDVLVRCESTPSVCKERIQVCFEPILTACGRMVTQERLRKAEEEAATLREQLQKTQQDRRDSSESPTWGLDPKQRVDERTTYIREGGFLGGGQGKSPWLQESQLAEFLASGGPTEAEKTEPVTEEEKAIVSRRLLGGIALSAGAIAFALVPLGKKKPMKPLYFYLTSVLITRSALEELEEDVENVQWEDARSLLERLLGPPNNIKSNLLSAAGYLEDKKAYRKADTLARDAVEYLEEVDYTKYFDNRVVPAGKQEREFVAFSKKCIRAASSKLDEFLTLMPRDAVEAARATIEA